VERRKAGWHEVKELAMRGGLNGNLTAQQLSEKLCR
jgi:hypothetical protein